MRLNMNRYLTLGILLIFVGTFCMSQIITYGPLIILGVVLNGLGILSMAKGSSIASDKSKAEIIDRINHFREEIKRAKEISGASESLKEIEVFENEFNEWADDFLKNVESRQIAKKKSEILLREKEIELSKKWRHVYEYLIEVIFHMSAAFNTKSTSAIEFIFSELPENLYSEEAESYRARLIFDDNNAWEIKFLIRRPYKCDEIPNVVISFFHGEHARQTSIYEKSTFLILSFEADKKRIILAKDDPNLYIGDLKDSYSIEPNKYKDEIKELFKTLIEYQLISLQRMT
jgi:hypothetical protein